MPWILKETTQEPTPKKGPWILKEKEEEQPFSLSRMLKGVESKITGGMRRVGEAVESVASVIQESPEGLRLRLPDPRPVIRKGLEKMQSAFELPDVSIKELEKARIAHKGMPLSEFEKREVPTERYKELFQTTAEVAGLPALAVGGVSGMPRITPKVVPKRPVVQVQKPLKALAEIVEPPKPQPTPPPPPKRGPTVPEIKPAKPPPGELFAGRETLEFGKKPIIGREVQPGEFFPKATKEAEQLGIPIKEGKLPLEERARLLERAGQKEAADKLRRTEGKELVPTPKPTDPNVPDLVRAHEGSDGIIYLSFDDASRVPTAKELKSFLSDENIDVAVVKFAKNIISGTRRETNYRIDVFDAKTGNISSERAKEVFGKVGGFRDTGSEFVRKVIRPAIRKKQAEAKIPFMTKKYTEYEEITGTKSLARVIHEAGGVKAHRPGLPGAIREEFRENVPKFLIRKEGMASDEAVSVAQEHGYPQIQSETELLQALAEEQGSVMRGLSRLTSEEEQIMEFMRSGGKEIGAISIGPITPKPGTVTNIPKLKAMRAEAATEYKQTIGDKVLDAIPFLRTAHRYLSNTKEGFTFTQSVHELERTVQRAGNIAGDAVDKAFAPIRGRGLPGALGRMLTRSQVEQASKNVARALDGQMTLTNPAEIMVAKKLRRILNFYADAHGLPLDARISDYFPHIFKGQYRVRIVGPDGIEHTIPGGFAATQRQAYVKAEEYLSKLVPEEAGKARLVIEETFDPNLMTDLVATLDSKRFKALKKAILEEQPVEEVVKLAGKLAHGPGPKPTVFFRHVLKRRANLQGFEPDAYKVLRQYVRGANRKIYFDRFLPEAERQIQRLPEHQRAYAQHLIDYLKGAPSATDKTVDRMLKNLGFDLAPQSAMRVSRAVRSYFYVTKLGLGNLSGAAVNLLTLFTNAPIKIGPGSTATGIRLYFKSLVNPKLKNILKTEGPTISHRGDIDPVAFPGMVRRIGEATAYPFQAVEDLTHGAVFLGARQKYLKQHIKPGMTSAQKRQVEKAANQYGRNMDIESQIPQTKATRPEFFRDPILGASFQFKTFFAKELEFFAHLSAKEKAAFVATTMIVGGPFVIPGIRYMSDRNPEFAEAVDWVNDNLNIPRLMGLDFSGDAGIGFVPDSFRDLPGPAGQVAVTATDAALNLATGESRKATGEELKRGLKRTLMPSVPMRAGRAMEAIKEGVMKDERGRPIVEVEPYEALEYLMFGGRSKAHAKRLQTNRRFRVLEQQEKTARRNLIDRLLDANEERDAEAQEKTKQQIKDHNRKYGPLVGAEITNKAIKHAAESRKMLMEERISRSSRKRGGAYQRFMEKMGQ